MSDRAYPLPVPTEDSRFTYGLIYDIRQRLEAAGYPPLTSADHIQLQLALYRFLYEVPVLTAEQLNAIRTRTDREAADRLTDWERELLDRTDTEELTDEERETLTNGWAEEAAAEEAELELVAIGPATFAPGDVVNVNNPGGRHHGVRGEVVGTIDPWVADPGVVIEYDDNGNTLTIAASRLMPHEAFLALDEDQPATPARGHGQDDALHAMPPIGGGTAPRCGADGPTALFASDVTCAECRSLMANEARDAGDADPDFEFHPTSAEDYEATTATGKHAP